MKTLKRKCALLLALLASLIVLTSCGSDQNQLYLGKTAEELINPNQSIMVSISEMSDMEVEFCLANSESLDWDPLVLKFFLQYCDYKDELGAFTGFADYEITETQKTLTVSQECVFENRNAYVTVVYDALSKTPSDMTFDIKYTLGETMKKAGLNTVMGIGTVFCMLIIICLIITCFGLFGTGKKKESSVSNDAVVTQIAAREEQEEDDTELVAVISAAIAAATGASTDAFVVRSIKRRA